MVGNYDWVLEIIVILTGLKHVVVGRYGIR